MAIGIGIDYAIDIGIGIDYAMDIGNWLLVLPLILVLVCLSLLVMVLPIGIGHCIDNGTGIALRYWLRY